MKGCVQCKPRAVCSTMKQCVQQQQQQHNAPGSQSTSSSSSFFPAARGTQKIGIDIRTVRSTAPRRCDCTSLRKAYGKLGKSYVRRFRIKYGWKRRVRSAPARFLALFHPRLVQHRADVAAMIAMQQVHPRLLLNYDQVYRHISPEVYIYVHPLCAHM